MNCNRGRILTILSLMLICACVSSAARADAAPDFPPGLFSDGARYSLADLRGKVVVLYLFEHDCPRCRGEVPVRNKLVKSFAGKPVLFIGIDPGHTITDAQAYARETKLAMPVFADALRVMEGRYHQHISLNNIYQYRVIGPDGSIAGNSEQDIERVVQSAKWKFKDKDYDPKLNAALELFEWNQYARGMRVLRPLMKDHNKTVAESAAKLYEEIKAQGEQWKADAEALAEGKPAEAFVLYSRVAEVFAGEPLAKSVEEPLKKLRVTKEVKEELAARQMFSQLNVAMSRAMPQQRLQVRAFCKNIATRFVGTPTAALADALSDELDRAPGSTARAD